MEKQTTAIQWSSVLMLIGVMSFALLGVQQYARQGIQGRLKSSTDDIGDQFSPGTTRQIDSLAKVMPSEHAAATVVGNKKEAVGQLAMAVSKDKFAETEQYEPYYLASSYETSRQDVKIASLKERGRINEGYQKSSYVAVEAISSGNEVAKGGAAPVMAPTEAFDYAARANYSDRRIVRDEEQYNYNGQVYQPIGNNESYDQVYENAFLPSLNHPLSTFSIDVDTASYSNVRRFLNQGQLPPIDAVRVEELVNYFSYDYPEPTWGQPFSITTEVAPCPWNPSHQLALVGLQGKRLNALTMPASNLVFLVDVSGSMNDPAKLPLLQNAFRMMTSQLEAKDRVSIVVYAGAAGVVLNSTAGNQKEQILDAINHLQAGGSTAGGAGIQLAYQIARANFIANGNNRVILATDGDFNVGISDDSSLVNLIEGYRNQGIFLTVLGFGQGNYKDSKMEKLADKGNGNYFYIDNISEAQKVLVNELGSTIFTIAKDVKLQVEFNPATVRSYRLIGYENRIMAKEDFNDDTKDAGELGAGHTVTALYEIIPEGSWEGHTPGVDPLVYQKTAPSKGNNRDLMTVKLRYKDPKGETSKLLRKTVEKSDVRSFQASDNLRFASAVAEFGLLLKQSPYRGNASFDHVLSHARASKLDKFGYRAEFIGLVERAKALAPYITPVMEEDQGHQPSIYYGTPQKGKAQK